MTFLESPRFPDCISFGATGGPVWSTTIVRTGGGYEYSNQNYEFPLCTFDVSHAVKTPDNFAILLAFQRAVRGRFHRFRFKDWSDYSATSTNGIFAMLSSTTFQMYKTYVAGSLTHNRIIQKPVSGTITVTGVSGASVATATGIVTVSSGTPTAWSGEFDVPCRFDQDDLKANLIASKRRLIGWSGIGISEVRL